MVGAPDPEPAIEIEHLTFSYPRAAWAGGVGADPRTDVRASVLEDVSLTVRRGERLGILGPNGGGKSTLLKLVLGLLTGYSGRIEVFGRSPQAARREGLIGYLPQKVDAVLAFPLSVRQVVSMSASSRLAPWRSLSSKGRRGVERALDLVGALELAERPVGQLSGGQLQRVMIARALAGSPRALVLDEPTVGIDVGGQRRFSELVSLLHAELGLTVVIVSHDLRTVAASSDRVACLRRTLHYHDAPLGLTPAVLAEVFSHDVESIFGEVHVEAHTAEGCTDPSHAHHTHGGAPGSGRADD